MVLKSNPVVIRNHSPPLPRTNDNVFFEPFVWGEGRTGILCPFPVEQYLLELLILNLTSSCLER